VTTLSAKLKLYISSATSLKDKRQVRQSIIAKIRQKFNLSIAEVDTQDIHQTLTIGVAVVSTDRNYAQQMIDEIVRFVEENAEAELVEIEMN